MKQPLIVTITSDFICPWCYIAERRLSKALATLPEDVTVETRWRPFELNPNMPLEGIDRRTYRTMKFGSWERSQALDAHTVQAAQGDSLTFNYAAIQKTPNTFLAHRLMQRAAHQGVASVVAGALFFAYFEQGRDIGDINVLIDIASERGMDRDLIAAFLASDEGGNEVRMAQQVARNSQVSSVPQFEIGDEVISGAQPVEHLTQSLQRAISLSAMR